METAAGRRIDGYVPVVQPSNPRIVVLGGPVPESLRLQLLGNIDFYPEAEIESGNWAGILVHARSESLPAVRRFRNAGGRAAIYGLSESRVDVKERIQWIREGADDLLSLDTASGVLARRLRGPATRQTAATPSVPTGVRVDRYLTALQRYLTARGDVLTMLGDSGRQIFLDCHFLRDQVLRVSEQADPDLGNGQRRGSEREPMQWGVRLVDRANEAAVLGASAELQNIGADGLGLALHAPIQPGDTARVEIDGYTLGALVTIEVRWQRRAARERWEIGAFALAMEFTKGGPQ